MLCIPVSEKFYACYGFVQESPSVKRISCLFLCSFQSFEKPFIITKKNPIGTSKTSTSQAQIKFPMSTFDDWTWLVQCGEKSMKNWRIHTSILRGFLLHAQPTMYKKQIKIVTIYDFARLRRNMKFLASKSQILFQC